MLLGTVVATGEEEKTRVGEMSEEGVSGIVESGFEARRVCFSVSKRCGGVAGGEGK